MTTEKAEASPTPATSVVTLDVPIKRASGDVTTVTLRRPNAGALRGLQLAALLQMDVLSLHTILPRITEPMIHKQEAVQLDPADLVALGTEVVNFLVPKAQRVEFQSE